MKKLFSIFTLIVGSLLIVSSCSDNSSQKTAYLKAMQAFETDSAETNTAQKDLMQVAVLKSTVIIPACRPFNAHNALAEDGYPDFWHRPSFSDMYSKIGVTYPTTNQNLNIFQNVKSASLGNVLAQVHAKPMSLSEFATTLVYLTSKQPNGESGKLSTDGTWNIFYVEIAPNQCVAVDVSWYSLRSEWGVYVVSLEGEWGAGRQFFLRSGSGS